MKLDFSAPQRQTFPFQQHFSAQFSPFASQTPNEIQKFLITRLSPVFAILQNRVPCMVAQLRYKHRLFDRRRKMIMSQRIYRFEDQFEIRNKQLPLPVLKIVKSISAIGLAVSELSELLRQDEKGSACIFARRHGKGEAREGREPLRRGTKRLSFR
jgi:hypothetical protein